MPNLKDRMAAGDRLTGTFVKTPAIEMVEILAKSGLDFLCLDAEHNSYDRGRMDYSLAMGKALGVPMLVRVPAGRAEIILGALDSGATGIVVPHVHSAEKAAEIALAARYKPGGRGFAGATRWANFGGESMADLMARSEAETVVLVQIEEVEGVEAAEAIAATPGIDGLFIGPADLSLAYGKTSRGGPELDAAFHTVGEACRKHGKTFVTWAPNAEEGMQAVQTYGVSMMFIASEQTWILDGATSVANAMKRS